MKIYLHHLGLNRDKSELGDNGSGVYKRAVVSKFGCKLTINMVKRVKMVKKIEMVMIVEIVKDQKDQEDQDGQDDFDFRVTADK